MFERRVPPAGPSLTLGTKSRLRRPSSPTAPAHLPWLALGAQGAQGYDAPEEDRRAVDRAGGEGAAAYGELLPESVERLLRWLAPGPEDVLYDLGSGTGKLVAQTVCTTAVGRAVGVELSGFRHRAALDLRAALLERLPDAERRRMSRRFELRREDLRTTFLEDATIIYAGSTAYPDPLLADLAARAHTLPALRALVSTRPLPSPWDRRFTERGSVRLATSWFARERVVVYEPSLSR